eukprot:NODE_1615_length_2420_cov_5.034453.p1 GENE.NODE_1615_length_2420_cov_5.034453~~NODE_1615_length_2420_cov_5.034453.p1  ORF type:complete len:698 (+),score=228.31 NODE_1615_length_2420_cov_5.034453:162-2255(+)
MAHPPPAAPPVEAGASGGHGAPATAALAAYGGHIPTMPVPRSSSTDFMQLRRFVEGGGFAPQKPPRERAQRTPNTGFRLWGNAEPSPMPDVIHSLSDLVDVKLSHQTQLILMLLEERHTHLEACLADWLQRDRPWFGASCEKAPRPPEGASGATPVPELDVSRELLQSEPRKFRCGLQTMTASIREPVGDKDGCLSATAVTPPTFGSTTPPPLVTPDLMRIVGMDPVELSATQQEAATAGTGNTTEGDAVGTVSDVPHFGGVDQSLPSVCIQVSGEYPGLMEAQATPPDLTWQPQSTTSSAYESQSSSKYASWRGLEDDICADNLDRPPEHLLAEFLHSTFFNTVVAVLLCINGIVIGVQANVECSYYMDTANDGQPSGGQLGFCRVMEAIFTVMFALEMLLRLAVEQGQFFRMVRVFRVVKMLHALRAVRQFDALRRMVYSVMNSVVSLLWVVLMNAGATYVFAIYICQATSQYLRTRRETLSEAELEDRIADLEIFSDLSRTMLTVFMSFTGGLDWADVINPLLTIGLLHGVMYIVFFVFVVFGMLNVITGLFVESACTIASTDRTALIDSALEAQQRFRRDFTEVFVMMDRDGDGILDVHELHSTLDNERTRALLETLGLSCGNAVQLYSLLDEDGRGKVSLESFLDGCEALKGPAKNIDIMSLRLDVRSVLETLRRLHESSQECNSKLSARDE